MKAILVSVDYADLLAMTLPYNKHHFDEVFVITSNADNATKQVARENHCPYLATDSFWDDGAMFNKWKALEEGLTVMGRDGWICIMDADILWPKAVEVIDKGDTLLLSPSNKERGKQIQLIP